MSDNPIVERFFRPLLSMFGERRYFSQRRAPIPYSVLVGIVY